MAGDVKVPAYLFAGFSVFLTLRLALHGSSFSLIRFQIPEHLFSLYVDRIHNSMQLFTLFGSAFGTVWTNVLKAGDTKPYQKEYASIASNWALFSINVIILIAFIFGGKNGYITFFYWSMVISSFIFATNMQFILSMAGKEIVWYLAAENSTQILTSILHWILLLFYGNRRKHYTEYVVIVWQIVISSMVTGISAILWTLVYHDEGSSDNKRAQAVKALKGLEGAIKDHSDRLSEDSNELTEVKQKAGPLQQAANGLKTALGNSNCTGQNGAQGKLEELESKARTLHGANAQAGAAVKAALIALQEPLTNTATAMESCSALTDPKYGSNLVALTNAANNLTSKIKQLVNPKTESVKVLNDASKAIGNLIDHGITQHNQLQEVKDKAGPKGTSGTLAKAAQDLQSAASGTCTQEAEGNVPTKLTTLETNADAVGQLGDGDDETAVKQKLESLKSALAGAATAIGKCDKLNTQHQSELRALADASNELKQAADKAYGANYDPNWAIAFSPMAMCVIGLGMVFAFYPAIAPGMMVDFRLVHGIDLVLLVVSPIPSVSIALMSKLPGTAGINYFNNVNPATRNWEIGERYLWHLCHIFTITEITCAILFIVTLHYPQSFVSKSIYRKSAMTCFVSIVFYMSQEILAAVGYGGVEGNAGKGKYKDILSNINNFLVRLSMIIFIFFAEGYIVEYKSLKKL